MASINKENITNVSNFNLSGSLYQKSNISNENTQFLKEKEELKECTFKPKINNLLIFSEIQNIKEFKTDTFNRLYTDHERYNNKKLIKTLQKEYRDSQISCFSPNLSVNKNHRLSPSLKSKKFFDRLDEVFLYKNYKIFFIFSVRKNKKI